jgi:hypothetical protein
MEGSPEISDQLPSLGDNDLIVGFSSSCHAGTPPPEAVLGPVGEGDDARGLALPPPAQIDPHFGPVAVVPRCLDEETADVVVAGPGDAAPLVGVPAGVFTGDQSQIGHEGPRGAEASEVVEFGHEVDGSDGVDATEATEPGHGFPVRLLATELGELGVEGNETFLELFEGKKVAVEGGLFGGPIEA